MNSLVLALIISAFVLIGIALIALIYFILGQRRRSIIYKKVDYLVEDLTYKAETLTSTVETVAKMANYIDVFEAFTRKNLKSVVRLYERNKDDLYKVVNRVTKLATGETKKKGGKK